MGFCVIPADKSLKCPLEASIARVLAPGLAQALSGRGPWHLSWKLVESSLWSPSCHSEYLLPRRTPASLHGSLISQIPDTGLLSLPHLLVHSFIQQTYVHHVLCWTLEGGTEGRNCSYRAHSLTGPMYMKQVTQIVNYHFDTCQK